MGSIFVWNRGEDPEEEMRLGTPDEAEAKDLARHVDRCALRYRLFTKRLRSQGTQISRIEWLLYGVAAYILGFSGGPVHNFIVSIFAK